ncbi:MAG: hypothetical protein B7Y80_03515 [Hyphomicrobium sp. 32-62-53]|nr:MAG: hypothetical protein B7Z29_06755 [Hyphomicrobium sp. 12-62-95]OYY00993.1 MAG: hypothetical protein B7Y80_03515 [Hyphomicrobium sp. 32-62-53]
MAHVIWKSADRFAKAALPKSHLPPDEQLAALREAGLLPFPSDTPHIVLADNHAAAALPASQVSVDWATGAVAILPKPAILPAEADYAEAIQSHIDSVAHARGYGNGAMLASYVASTVPAWAAEAQTFVAWRDAVWLAAYGRLGAVKAGEADPPAISALIGLLPPISWPAT